jgi:DNA-binding transcriptional LysR family regulator
MELRHFRYFIAVAEELSFTKAAKRLHISQPPLSQHVQEIERELGTLLFRRNRSHVALTDTGRLFLDEARSVVQQASHAVDMAKRAGRGEVGVLRIGFTATAPFTHVFSAAIRAFRRESPGVRLNLEYSMTEPVIEALRTNELDVGFVRPMTDSLPDDIGTILVMTDRLMAVVHADHPLAALKQPIPIGMLANEPFVLRASGAHSGYYEQIYQCCIRAGFFPQIAQEAKEAATILGLVATGLGVTILPASLGAIAVSGVAWRELESPANATSQVLLAFNAKENDTAQREAFIRLVQSEVERSDHCATGLHPSQARGPQNSWALGFSNGITSRICTCHYNQDASHMDQSRSTA